MRTPSLYSSSSKKQQMGNTSAMKQINRQPTVFSLVLKSLTPRSIITKVQGSSMGAIRFTTCPLIISHLWLLIIFLRKFLRLKQEVNRCIRVMKTRLSSRKMKETRLLETKSEDTPKKRPRGLSTFSELREEIWSSIPKMARKFLLISLQRRARYWQSCSGSGKLRRQQRLHMVRQLRKPRKQMEMGRVVSAVETELVMSVVADRVSLTVWNVSSMLLMLRVVQKSLSEGPLCSVVYCWGSQEVVLEVVLEVGLSTISRQCCSSTLLLQMKQLFWESAVQVMAVRAGMGYCTRVLRSIRIRLLMVLTRR